jgi:hypothetical protein
MTINPYQSPADPAVPRDVTGVVMDVTVLRFDLEMEDLIAFSRFHYDRSPVIRKQYFGVFVITAAVIFFGFLMVFDDMDLLARIVLAGPNALVGGMLMYYWSKRSMPSQMRQLLEEGDNSSVFGQIELRLENDAFVEIGRSNESRYAFEGIKRVGETPDHAFLYTSALQAIVIPKEKIVTGDVGQFMTVLRRRVPGGSPSRG